MEVIQHKGFIEVRVFKVSIDPIYEKFDKDSKFFVEKDTDGMRHWVMGKNKNGTHKLDFFITPKIAQSDVDMLTQAVSKL